MRALSAIVLLALVAGGCRYLQPEPDPDPEPVRDTDGVSCHGDTVGAPAVYVELDYAADAQAKPPCEVDRHTVVTWRAPARSEGFQLEFGAISPAGRGAPTAYASRERDGVPKVQLQADAEPGEYPYDVIVGGEAVDPVIIIRR